MNDLAEPFDLSLPAVSKHLKVLERAGLISRGRQAQFRPCRIEAEALHEASDWIQQYPSGGITHHPMAPEWPAEMLSSMTVEELEPARTQLTLRVAGVQVDERSRAIFESSFDSMRGGFGGTYDVLEAYLAKL